MQFNIFKLINSQTENFHKSAKLLPNKSLVLQNADPNIHSLNNTNEKKSAKSIATYQFPTLYT